MSLAAISGNNDENTVSFVTLNKVGGFLQRMDLALKYAFGKMLVIGSEPPFKVKLLWLLRSVGKRYQNLCLMSAMSWSYMSGGRLISQMKSKRNV